GSARRDRACGKPQPGANQSAARDVGPANDVRGYAPGRCGRFLELEFPRVLVRHFAPASPSPWLDAGRRTNGHGFAASRDKKYAIASMSSSSSE
ncbi:MAG: hypothetical protein WAV18_19545, partial [Roseiarcus sp.]